MRAEFILPFPISVNDIWGRAGRRTYRKKRYMAWREKALVELSGLTAEEPYAGRVRVEMRLYGPNKRPYDIDNMAKAVMDVLEGSLLVNDEQMDRQIMRRGHLHGPAGCVWVIITPAEEYEPCPRLPESRKP